MPREVLDIRHHDRLALLRRRSAHAPPEANLLTCRTALEGTEEEDGLLVAVLFGGWCAAEDGELILADVESGPVDRGGGGGESGVGVPEERGDVREVTI